MDVSHFQDDILKNQQRWQKKPILRTIYRGFHEEIAKQLSTLEQPLVVELGSGIGNIKDVIPHALRTDLFPNPWLDQTENAYKLSFDDGTVSDLILFDVFHKVPRNRRDIGSIQGGQFHQSTLKHLFESHGKWKWHFEKNET